MVISRLLQLDDLRLIRNPSEIAALFQKLGYNASARSLPVDDLELPARSAEAIWDAYLIADQGQGALQVLLFHLQEQEFSSPSIASGRMRAIASSHLVQKCLDAKGVGIEEWEAEIDDRVAHLYGLTDEEIKIIYSN